MRSVESYGIFVELTPNLAGLAELKENVHAGQHQSHGLTDDGYLDPFKVFP